MKTTTLLSLTLTTIILAGCGNASMPLVDSGAAGGSKSGSPQGSSAVYEPTIKNIFTQNCSTCHVPGGMGPGNWQDYDTAFGKKDKIFDRIVTKKDMPMGKSMDQKDRDLIAAWVKAGAPRSATPGPGPGPSPTPTPTPPPIPNPTPTPSPMPIDGSKLSFVSDIVPIVNNRCVMCHNKDSGDAMPNWLDYKITFAKKDKVFDRVVVKKDMPMGMEMPQNERDIFDLWIRNGAKEKPTPAPSPSPTPTLPPIDGPSLTFVKDILPIVKSRCVMCHNADSGDVMPNWLDYKISAAKKDKLFDRVVVKKDMPMDTGGEKMPQRERDIFDLWIRNGVKEK